MQLFNSASNRVEPWNKGKLVGQKPPLKLQQIWAIRIRLEMKRRVRDLALFNLAIDSKLRGCDLVALKVHDILKGGSVAQRAMVVQQKTNRPVRFEITTQARETLTAWIEKAGLRPSDPLFPHLSSHQESPGRAAVTWPHEAGEHGTLSGYRGRRRPGGSRANRSLGRAAPASLRTSCWPALKKPLFGILKG